MRNLSIVITTYNRKDSLIRMLKSIEVQGHIDLYHLVISDNHSDYDVIGWVKDHVSTEFFNNIEFVIRPYNIGGDLNISFSFQLCKSKWMWLLSDDDTVTCDSLQIITRDIIKYNSVIALKYSIVGYERNIDMTVNTFDGFLDYYVHNHHSAGEMIFMSNNIFHVELLEKYLGYAPMAADTYMSQLVPVFLSLIKDKKEVHFCPDYIVEYGTSEKVSYNSCKANICFANIIMFLNLNRSQSAKIRLLFKYHRQFNLLIIFQHQENSYIRDYMYKRFFDEYFSFFNLRDLFYWLFFHFCNIFNIKIEDVKHLYHHIKK